MRVDDVRLARAVVLLITAIHFHGSFRSIKRASIDFDPSWGFVFALALLLHYHHETTHSAMTVRVPSLQEPLEEFAERVGRVPTQQLKKALVSVYQVRARSPNLSISHLKAWNLSRRRVAPGSDLNPR